MGRYRALMTMTDRKRIRGKGNVSDQKQYQTVSRVRNRIDNLETDVEILEEHRPDLLEELQEVVCDEEWG